MSRTAVEILREFIGLSIDVSEKEESVEMGKVCKAWEDQKKLGVEEGRKSGIAIGREEERKNIALQMKKEGFSMDVIARVLQVSVNSVENFFL